MTEQDTVQIDAPDFDPDIDGPDTQQAHHNTVVVSFYELTSIILRNTPLFSCNILSKTQTIMGLSQGDHTHNHTILWAITLHPQTQQTFSAGMHVEEENVQSYTDTDSLEK